MANAPRTAVVRGLRRWAAKLESEAAISRHRLEISDVEKSALLLVASSMINAAKTLEGLGDG